MIVGLLDCWIVGLLDCRKCRKIEYWEISAKGHLVRVEIALNSIQFAMFFCGYDFLTFSNLFKIPTNAY
jgi:hypothetical protein